MHLFPNHSSQLSENSYFACVSLCPSVGIYNFLPLVVFVCLGNYLVSPVVLQIPTGQGPAVSFSQGGALEPKRCSIHLSSGDHVPKPDLCQRAKVPGGSCRAVGWAAGDGAPKLCRAQAPWDYKTNGVGRPASMRAVAQDTEHSFSGRPSGLDRTVSRNEGQSCNSDHVLILSALWRGTQDRHEQKQKHSRLTAAGRHFTLPRKKYFLNCHQQHFMNERICQYQIGRKSIISESKSVLPKEGQLMTLH